MSRRPHGRLAQQVAGDLHLPQVLAELVHDVEQRVALPVIMAQPGRE